MKRLLLISELGLYPIHFETFVRICDSSRAAGTAIVRSSAEVPEVHRQLGWVTPEEARERGVDVRLIPDRGRLGRLRWLRAVIREVRPDAVWIQQEPTDALLLDSLLALPMAAPPRVVGAVCENIFVLPLRARVSLPVLWRRLDALAGVATASIEGIRRAGMPRAIASRPLVAGALDPPARPRAAELPFPSGSFVALFLGRVALEKGIDDVLSALELLDPRFCLVVVGDGPSAGRVRARADQPLLRGRVAQVGLVPHADVWPYLASADCVVVPSLTMPRWKEQFGGAIADALAAGLPVVGSSSGAIPEVVGDAGLIVPERSPAALAAALARLGADSELRARLGASARKRFADEFSIAAYADKLARLLGLQEATALGEDA